LAEEVEETRFEVVETAAAEEGSTPITLGSDGKVVLKDLFVDIMDSGSDSQVSEEPNFLEQGREEMADGRITEAIVYFQKAIRDPQHEAEASYLLGLCFLKESHSKLAEKFFTRGLILPGQDDTFYNKIRYNLAVLYEMTDRVPDAIRELSEIEAKNPDYEDVVARIQYLKDSTG
jgi:Flp pilus assembly protein TadD